MGAVRALARSQTTVDTGSWTAIAAPAGDWNRVELRVSPSASGAVKFRTNDGSATTEFTLDAAEGRVFEAAGWRRSGFSGGETVIHAQAVSGTGPVEHYWS